MKLSERLNATSGQADSGGAHRPQSAPAAPEAAAAPSAPWQPDPAGVGSPAAASARRSIPEPPPAAVVDALGQLKERAAKELFGRLGTRLNDATLSDEQLRSLVLEELATVIELEDVPLSGDERQRLLNEIGDDVLGLGPLQRFLDDASVSEIMVNGPEMIYVERDGRLARVGATFADEDHLRRVIDRIVSHVGRRIDESSPLVDARLADGSRVNAIIPPLAVNGSSLTIRKFAKDPLDVRDLIAFGTLSPGIAELLHACVRSRLNVIISGGTGTGKTTLLNVLSSFIPEVERIVTIEDAVELQLQQQHVVRLESRPANIEGKGEITIRDLVRNSLRMRPDRIVVGRVPRRGEPGHAAGHEHRPRGVSVDGARQLPARRAGPARNPRADGGHGPAAARDPRTGLVRGRPHRADRAALRRHPPHHPRDRGAGHGG